MAGKTPVTSGRRDVIVGAILLAFAVVWTVTVYQTVPAGRGLGVGPRAFPLYLGGALVVLSALLLLSGLREGGRTSAGEDDDAPEAMPLTGWPLVRILGSVTGIMIAYGFLMQRVGFLIATAVIVAVTLWFAIGVRKPLLVAGMAIGIPAGCWIAFGKVLGAYMPTGTWIPLF